MLLVLSLVRFRENVCVRVRGMRAHAIIITFGCGP